MQKVQKITLPALSLRNIQSRTASLLALIKDRLVHLVLYTIMAATGLLEKRRYTLPPGEQFDKVSMVIASANCIMPLPTELHLKYKLT